MTERIPFKYRAFLSYSHHDKRWGKWLHAALESYRVEKDLVGRKTSTGTVPKALRPIFRDREDFAAGHSLTQQTLAALDASEFLIVLCSPNAAKSKYVNEEVRRFKAMGRPDRVIPVIVGGEPSDSDRDCFPPALRFKIGPTDNLSTEDEEPIAADARPQGDGKEIAKQKIVAALLGLPLDELVRRGERARKRHLWIRNSIISILLALTLASAAGFAWARYELSRNEALLDRTLQRATALVNKSVEMSTQFGIPRTISLSILEEADALFRDMSELSRETVQLRYRKALMLIAFANNYGVLGNSEFRRQRAEAAVDILQQLTKEQPANTGFQFNLARAFTELGDALQIQGNLRAAAAQYEVGLFLNKKLGLQDNLSVLHERLGDNLLRQGRLAEAVQHFLANLELYKRQAAARPFDSNVLLGLSVAFERVGNILLSSGDKAGALDQYRQVLAINERLSSSDPANPEWQRNLSVSHHKMGDVLLAQERLAESLAQYRADLAIIDHLAATDRTNAGWQRDVAVAYGMIGDVLVAQGNAHEAIENYKRKMLILERLIKLDPSNAYWQSDLAVSHSAIADARVAEGNLEEASSSYRRSHEILERVVASDPTIVDWQLDLLFSHSRLALFGDKPVERFKFIVETLLRLKKEGRLTSAEERWIPFAEEGLAAAGRDNKQRQWDLLNIYWRTVSLTRNPVRQAALVVAMLRKLKDENKLTEDQIRWLPLAEAQVANMQKQ
jgi:tetratricopeptide (TPR) repeat protein